VTCPSIFFTCSAPIPLCLTRKSISDPAKSAGVSGASSKEWNVTSTLSVPNSSTAFSKRRFPIKHQGQAISDQISTLNFAESTSFILETNREVVRGIPVNHGHYGGRCLINVGRPRLTPVLAQNLDLLRQHPRDRKRW